MRGVLGNDDDNVEIIDSLLEVIYNANVGFGNIIARIRDGKTSTL